MKMDIVSIAVLALTFSHAAEAQTRSYGNDALPSSEMIAFNTVHARLRWADAKIEYDARECAVYQGKARDGRIQRRPLFDKRGRRLCTRH